MFYEYYSDANNVETIVVSAKKSSKLYFSTKHKASFTYDRLGRYFCFVYTDACIAVFLRCYRFSVNKDLYVLSKQLFLSWELPLTHPQLYYKEIRVSPKISVGTSFWNFAANSGVLTSKISPRQVDGVINKTRRR